MDSNEVTTEKEVRILSINSPSTNSSLNLLLKISLMPLTARGAK